MKTEEIKTWRDRITTPTTNQKNLFMSMQAEIDELREAFANLHSDYDIIEIDRDELKAKLAALEAQKIPAAIAAALSNCENLAIASGAHEAYRVVGQAFNKLRATIAAGAAPADEWRDAVLDALASHAMDAPLTDTPQQIVKKLMDMVVTMARDPAITAGAAPAAKVPEWMPIETAPKDGQCLLWVKTDDGGEVMKLTRDADGAWLYEGEPTYSATFYIEPTHWMPLPSAPKGNL